MTAQEITDALKEQFDSLRSEVEALENAGDSTKSTLFALIKEKEDSAIRLVASKYIDGKINAILSQVA